MTNRSLEITPEPKQHPQPLFTLETLRDPAFQLRYGWTGWITNPPAPAADLDQLFRSLDPSWETDGLRRLEHHVVDGTWQITVSAKPHISPVFLATRVKGRLQHALRKQGNRLQFSRKLAVWSIGAS